VARTEVLPKNRYGVYLERSSEFERQMNRAAAERAWNSVGLLGVHSVISACDALTVQRAGQRWSGQDHAGAIGVVSGLRLPDADRVLRHVSRVLDAKNRVEYEAREFTEKEADEIRRNVVRVNKWIRSQLPS
jgi:hypothetical protein